MKLQSFGDLAQAFQTGRQSADLKSRAARLTGELTTGRSGDPGRLLGGDFGPLAGIGRTLTALTSYARAASEAAGFADGVQTVLGRLQDLGAGATSSLLKAGGNSAFVEAAGRDTRDALDAALSALNTRHGDRSLLAGTATSGPAVVDASALIAAVLPAVSGQTTAQGVAAAVAAWFAAPTGGFASLGYLGSTTPLTPFRVAPGDSVALQVDARDPAIAGTLAGLVTGALLAEGVLAGNPAERAALAVRAGEAVLSADSGLALLRGRVGTAEARIDAAATRIDSERAALEIRRADTVGVDPYETATALQQTQSELEMLFTVTARLSRLKMSDFL